MPGNQGILLLRNGQILEGKVSQVEGAHVVELPGGQIRVKNADVEMFCTSLEEAYRRKRSLVQAGDAYQHLELAQWCLRHKLLDFAGDEITAATEADPNNPMLSALRHRVNMAREPLPTVEAKAAQPALTNEELDRMMRNLPHGSVEVFTQSVQPVLMNHCMSGGCHGSQAENGLQLHRIPFGKTASHRLTQRNLHSVLQYLDRENPSKSRLLKIVIEPHGGSQTPIFSDRQVSQYQRLLDWSNQIGRRPELAMPISVTPNEISDASMPGSANPVLAQQPRVLPREAGKRANPIRDSVNGRARHNGDAESASSEKPKVEASSFAQPPSGDPFDPEIFNRRQEAKK